MTAASPTIGRPSRASLADALRGATPALLFGLRLWASVCLSFYVAFALELSEPSWAATTAALVCQPVLGASLRKSMFRMIGTVVGAIAIVILAALFRQDRVGFLVGLTLWCAASAFVATILRNFATYAAALSGYTAAIIAIDVLGPVGSSNGIVFMFAIDRAIEICIGIVSAGVVLALTDLGHSRRKLATETAAISSAIMDGFAECFATASGNLDKFRGLRRELLRRVIALYPIIDAAIGEASDLRYRSKVLQRAVAGLMETISAWRKVAFALALNGDSSTPQEANAVHDLLPQARLSPNATRSADEPAELRDACCAAVRSLTRFEAQTPMQRLLADNAAAGMLGMARALNGLTGRNRPARRCRRQGNGAAARRRLDAGLSQRRAHPSRGRGDVAVLDRDRLAERRCGDHVLRRDRDPACRPRETAAYSASAMFLQGSTLERRARGDRCVRDPSEGDDIP